MLAALLYGVTFPLVQDALDDITPFAYLAGRFVIATLARRCRRSCVRSFRRPHPSTVTCCCARE